MCAVLQKRWLLKPPPERHLVEGLKTAINASDALASLLVQRGFTDFNAAGLFLTKNPVQLHSPLLMRDMDKAVQRITKAIEGGENILVYGDYDVDGTTSVAMMYSFLSEHYEAVSFYLPDRYKEGYGVSTEGIDFASDNGITLVIALDCGIKSVDKVRYAKDKGIDFIICDHHLPGESLPEAAAILNPLQPGCEYPYKYLSGCGIGLKLIQALCHAWKLDTELTKAYVDLAAVAAACDIVPMTGENRVLTHMGIMSMQRALRPGIALLFEKSGLYTNGKLKENLSVSDLVFKLGPPINAAGRMDHGTLAVDLLRARSLEEAEEFAERIFDNNAERRSVDKDMLEEALSMMEDSADLRAAKTTVLYAEHWHKGVVGIAASRIQEHYYRPTIMLCASNGKITGSARSVRDFDVHAAIEQCADLLVNYGGHAAAAGLTMEPQHLDAFRERFENTVSQSIREEQLTPVVEIDLEIGFRQITDMLYNNIQRMAPFGPQNMTPVFVTHDVIDTGKSRTVGGDNLHLKLEVTQRTDARTTMKGIAFNMGHMAEKVRSGKPFSMVYSLEENVFRDRRSIEMMVKDIHFQ